MPTKKRLTRQPALRTAISDARKVQKYLRLPYARILIPEADGRFSAEVLEFPGCVAQGDTVEEAFADLERAAKLWIIATMRMRQRVPPPSANYGYSGKFPLRLPRELHRLVARKAERDGVSVNQCLVTAIAAWVGVDNFYERLLDRLEKAIGQPEVDEAAVNSNRTCISVASG